MYYITLFNKRRLVLFSENSCRSEPVYVKIGNWCLRWTTSTLERELATVPLSLSASDCSLSKLAKTLTYFQVCKMAFSVDPADWCRELCFKVFGPFLCERQKCNYIWQQSDPEVACFILQSTVSTISKVIIICKCVFLQAFERCEHTMS